MSQRNAQMEYVLAIYPLHSFLQLVCRLAPDTTSSIINSAFNCIAIAFILVGPQSLKVIILLLFHIYCSNLIFRLALGITLLRLPLQFSLLCRFFKFFLDLDVVPVIYINSFIVMIPWNLHFADSI